MRYLAGTLGPRNSRNYGNLKKAAQYIFKEFEKYGYKPKLFPYKIHGKSYYNVVAELRGKTRPDEIIVVGAHYDSAPVRGCRAADDNGSAVAAMLCLAKYFHGKTPDRTLRFVAFPNEEPPFFKTRHMGSYVYAKMCKDNKDDIKGMVCLESIGYYSDKPNSQKYPKPFNLIYPSTGNFIAFVGFASSGKLILDCYHSFRKHSKFPVYFAGLPPFVRAAGFSDHWSFNKFGYPAFMVTDTAPYRNPNYHTSHDNPDTLDYSRMARVTAGLQGVISHLVMKKTNAEIGEKREIFP